MDFIFDHCAMSILIALLFYSQLVDNATSVLCSRWDPQANGVSEICSCYIYKQHFQVTLRSNISCVSRLSIEIGYSVFNSYGYLISSE